jgi:hypothetical protein
VAPCRVAAAAFLVRPWVQVPTQPHPEVEGGLHLKELIGAAAVQTGANGVAEFRNLSFTFRGQVAKYSSSFAFVLHGSH